MAEYEYLEEEIDISGDLIPCEFCGDLFPIGVLIEHSSGCQPELFHGSGEPDEVPKITPQHPTNFTKWDEEIILPKVIESKPIRIEHLVQNDVFAVQSKNDGGCVMKRVSDLGSDRSIKTDKPSSYIHYKTNFHEEDQCESSESDDDKLSSKGESEQAKSSFSSVQSDSIKNLHLDTEDLLQLSDDNNEGNETVESFLLRASLELRKIKRSLGGARPKFASYCNEEEGVHHHHQSPSFEHQDCY